MDRSGKRKRVDPNVRNAALLVLAQRTLQHPNAYDNTRMIRTMSTVAIASKRHKELLSGYRADLLFHQIAWKEKTQVGPGSSYAIGILAEAARTGTVRALLARRDINQNTALHCAFILPEDEYHGEWELVLDAEIDEVAVQMALRYGADPNALNAKGETPLHLAAKYPRAKPIIALLKGGARTDINTGGRYAPYPVHHAIAYHPQDNGQSLSVLIRATPAHILNSQDGSGNTLLHLLFTVPGDEYYALWSSGDETAVPRLIKKMIRLLKRRGARLDIRNAHGKLPRDLVTPGDLMPLSPADVRIIKLMLTQ
jgi:hypothetical protein